MVALQFLVLPVEVRILVRQPWRIAGVTTTPAIPYLPPALSPIVAGGDPLSNIKGDLDDGIKGDLNGDGTIDGSDVSALLEMVLSGGLTAEQVMLADINDDGSVNGADVSALLEVVLSGD